MKALARAIAGHLARTLPQRFSTNAGAAYRVGKVFVHVRTLSDILAGGADPWAGYWRSRQTLEHAAALRPAGRAAPSRSTTRGSPPTE